MRTVVNDNSLVYYANKYWNDYEQGRAYINQKATGDPDLDIIDDFKKRYAKKPFKNGLFLNCGNGWVERLFIKKRIVEKVSAFDYSEDLLKKAIKAGKSLPINYFQSDINKLDLGEDRFDLIVNYAALHHTQYINKTSLMLLKAIKKNGVLFNFDYIGPHRNQYSRRQWKLINQVNNLLPKKYQHPRLFYPHIPTMLVSDPTEAIHSELIIECQERYFDIVERHDVGGGVAYMLLLLNENIPYDKRHKIVDKIFQYDDKYTKEKLVPSLFSYFIGRPKKKDLVSKSLLKKYQIEEDHREFRSGLIENTYSLRDYLWLIASGRRDLKLVINRFIRLLNYFLFGIFLKNFRVKKAKNKISEMLKIKAVKNKFLGKSQ